MSLLPVYRDGLLGDTVPFWLKHGLDREHQGVITSVDQSGEWLDTDKGVWQQGRFCWLLAELYNNVEQRQEWLDAALQLAAFIDRHCFDPADGRMWFHVTRDGQPIRKRRYAFSESFAAIAYGELALATGDALYAEKARHAFARFTSHNRTPPPELAKYTGTRPQRGIGPPMITINTAQELRGSIGLEDASGHIDNAIEDIRRFHLKPALECVMETTGPGGELLPFFEGRTLNPGHAIEGAWFIMSEGAYRNDAGLIATGLQMLDWMWARGWDQQYGGMLYFTSVDGRPLQEYWHDMKFWWPQNETIIATLLAYQLTGDNKYKQWHTLAHDWAYSHFPDTTHGEWYGYLRRDGSISNTLKGNMWKGPFHLPRMQLTCWQLLK